MPIDELGASLLASAWPETSARVAVLAIAFAAAFAIATIVLAVVDRAALARTRPLAERESRDQPTPARATSDRQMRSAVDVRRVGRATSERAVASGERVGTVTRPPAAVQIPAPPALQPQPVASRDPTSPLLDSDVREEPTSTLVLEFAGMARPARVRVRLFDAALDEEASGGGRRVSVLADAASIDSGDAELDALLKGPEVLDVERYPELRFESTSVRAAGAATYRVRGLLTARGRTREIVVAAVVAPGGGSPQARRAHVRARGSFAAADFDIGSPAVPVTDVSIVGDAVAIREA